MKWSYIVLLGLISACTSAQSSLFVGDWQEPGGTILRIKSCGNALCVKIRALSSNAPSITDIHNPNSSLRTRALCDLDIGSGFHLDGAAHAFQGQLYDPKSGNTYHGRMTVEGNSLKLRGYVGISLFGRTEEWRRVPPVDAPCHISAAR